MREDWSRLFPFIYRGFWLRAIAFTTQWGNGFNQGHELIGSFKQLFNTVIDVFSYLTKSNYFVQEQDQPNHSKSKFIPKSYENEKQD